MRARLEGLPIALIAAVVASLAFLAAFAVGWATAGTREHRNRAEREPAPAVAPPLVALGAVRPLPPAPPKRRGSRVATPPPPSPPPPRPPAASPGKLVSGTG